MKTVAALSMGIVCLSACSPPSDGAGKDAGNLQDTDTTATSFATVYSPTSQHELGIEARRPLLADLDGDGDLDVLVAHQFSRGVRTFLGDGSGELEEGPTLDVGRVADCAVADFDADGTIDLIAAIDGELDLVLLSDVLGAAELTTYSLTGTARGIAPGDFDGDEDLDVAVSISAVGGDQRQEVALFLNDEGVFDGPRRVTTPFEPGAMQAVDADEDGDLDLIVTLETTAAVVLQNDGSANLAVGSPFELGEGVLAFTALQLDGVGGLDVVAADLTANSLNLAADIPRGELATLATIAAPFDVVALRANDDEALDLAATSVDDMAVFGLVSLSDGRYAPVGLVEVPDAVRLGALAAGDLDGDGLDDLLVVERNREAQGTLHVFTTAPR